MVQVDGDRVKRTVFIVIISVIMVVTGSINTLSTK